MAHHRLRDPELARGLQRSQHPQRGRPAIWSFLDAITEPALRPIRNVLPNLGGIDVSPIILLLLIFFIERVIIYYIYPAVI